MQKIRDGLPGITTGAMGAGVFEGAIYIRLADDIHFERMICLHNQRLRLNQMSMDTKIATNTPHSTGYDHFHLSSGINSKFIP